MPLRQLGFLVKLRLKLLNSSTKQHNATVSLRLKEHWQWRL